jgi:hypothetical protein
VVTAVSVAGLTAEGALWYLLGSGRENNVPPFARYASNPSAHEFLCRIGISEPSGYTSDFNREVQIYVVGIIALQRETKGRRSNGPSE